jgi:hypothetical protein
VPQRDEEEERQAGPDDDEIADEERSHVNLP